MHPLNPEQQAAVVATEGRVLVLAGAGSGKTAVLTHRIAYLIAHCKVEPGAILGLTFTNKAAKQMCERLKKMVPSHAAQKVHLLTFHSFCAKLLRQEIHHLGYTKHFSIYDEEDQKRLLKHVAKDTLNHEGELPSLAPIQEAIARAKTRGLRPDEMQESDLVRTLYGRFETALRAYNAIDFDSLLTLVVTLFEEHPRVLKTYQEKYRYLLIDEYQDTNPIQYKIASMLSREHRNLFVVGDDDQSIYGFRGADIKNILTFESDTIIKLQKNYRSTPPILAAANSVIKNNKERHSKTLQSTAAKGDLISLFHTQTEEEEAKEVVRRIALLKTEKELQWSDMAILYRSNHLARTFETALLEATWRKGEEWVRGIPYAVYGGLDLAHRSEIKDVIAFLKVIANPNDEEALLRIINVPRRGISNQALDTITAYCRSHGYPLMETLKELIDLPQKHEEALASLSKQAKGGIAALVEALLNARQKMESHSIAEGAKWLLQTIDYQKAINEEAKSEKVRQFKWDNVLSILEMITTYEKERTQAAEEASLSDFLANTLLDTTYAERSGKSKSENRVSVLTIHSAKGLEFEACFLTCLEDNLLPHEKNDSPQGLEEERRLFYVALTRAKKHLTLSMARTRKRMGKVSKTTPSRFLFEIPKELIVTESVRS